MAAEDLAVCLHKRFGWTNKDGTGPPKPKSVGTQIERIYETLEVHDRVSLAQRIDAEIARMRGWMKRTD